MIFLHSGGLITTVLLAIVVSSSWAAVDEDASPQELSIACLPGHEYDTMTRKCISVSCAAVNACDPVKEECRPIKRICDTRLPCKLFECVPKERPPTRCPRGTIRDPKSGKCIPMMCDAPNACGPKERCYPLPTKCTEDKYPCTQFVCGRKCGKRTDFDPATGECVPVTCDARRACSKKENCIPRKVLCRERPCKQYVCERKCPKGKKFNPLTKKCVKVYCEARKACRGNETCVPMRKKCPTEAPCAQYICKRNCRKGTEYDPRSRRCVPVSCDFEKACRPNETCVPKRVLCKGGLCPQFECKKCKDGYEYDDMKKACIPMTCEIPNACGPKQICTPAPVKCVRAPCPQYVCKDRKECKDGYEYDRKSGECVPVSCQAPNACARDEICVPSRRPCSLLPCQNFFCTKCRRQIRCNKPCKNGYVYDDNNCPTCRCLPEIAIANVTSVKNVTAIAAAP